MMRESRPVVEQPERRINPMLMALLAAVVLLVGLVAYFTTSRNPNQDKLSDQQIAHTEEQEQPASPEKRCSSKTTYDLIKRELFRRAAEGRVSEQAAYDEVEAYAVLRMENPVLESEDSGTGALHCSGSLSLDLPPGVVVAGGRHSLSADIDYTIDASGNVTVNNPESITAPLASLARIEQSPAPPTPNETTPQAPEGNAAVSQTPKAPAPPQPSYPGHPSFDCGKARSRGEIAVCSDTGLSALDGNMAWQYGRALAAATPDQRALLQTTRDHFIAYRDGCPNRECIAQAYIARMREIRAIMEGHLVPPR
jgi:hypothetical protein